MTIINIGIHKNHRKRMKDGILKNGLDSLNDIQILEWYLTYTIPYKDTNPLAHTLLDTFGTLANVLDAGYDNLRSIPGIGHETALYLSVTPAFIERYNKSRVGKDIILNTDAKIIKYFKQVISVTNVEKLYVACLGNNGRLMTVLTIDGYDETKIVIDMVQLLKDIVLSKATNIVFMHTHPYGDVEPSKEDECFTRELILRCNQLDIRVVGHFIFNGFSHHSMREFINNVYDEISSKS